LQPSKPCEGNANIAFELGRLHLAPLKTFIGGVVQSYYEKGFNNQDYQLKVRSGG
jgi:hypothetical protein